MSGVARAVVRQLAAAGVRRAYTVPGESFLPLLDAFGEHPDMRLVSTRHESGAAFMAEADAKLTGIPAVAMATRGVGATNLAIGVHTAYQDSTPMVVLLGQVETQWLGREAFQEVNLPTFYSEITKWGATAMTPGRVPELIGRALTIATSGRPGPTLVGLPADVLEGELPEGDGWIPQVVSRPPSDMDDAAADVVADRLRQAEQPVIIAGGGAQGARAELIAAAEALGAGVYAAFRRQDVFPNDHPHYCGHLTLGTPPETLKALRNADAVLVVGSRLSEITTQSYQVPDPQTWIAQIDTDPRVAGAVLPTDVAVIADARPALARLIAAADNGPVAPDWSDAHDAYLRSSAPSDAADGPLSPETVMAALTQTFPPDTLITNDAGNFSAFGHRYWRFTHPRTQLGPTSGAMGYGVPAAVAAACATGPGRRILALVGDGGFLMTGQELEVAVRLDLDITVVAFRNGMYGTIAMHQAMHIGRTTGTEISDVDIAAVARGYGAAAWQVDSHQGLHDALREAREHRGPAVVDVRCDPDVISPSATLSGLLERGGS